MSESHWMVLNPHYGTGFFLGSTTTLYSSTLFTIAGVFWFGQADTWYRLVLFVVAIILLFLLSRALARHNLKLLSWAFSVSTAFYLSISTYLFGYVLYGRPEPYLPNEHPEVLGQVNSLLIFLSLWSLSFSILSFYGWSRIQHPNPDDLK